MRKLKSQPYWVYFLIDQGEIVYIGCTVNLAQRMNQHTDKPHNAVRVFRYNDKWEALHNERRWTKFLIPHPKFNRFPFYYSPRELERMKRLLTKQKNEKSLMKKAN